MFYVCNVNVEGENLPTYMYITTYLLTRIKAHVI